MTIIQVAILAIIQGAAELLPVSSSAHVIVAEKLMGLNPTSPELTLLLVMLHTGTMFAVILYFWKSWRQTYFSSKAAFKNNALYIIIATIATGVVGLALLFIIKHLFTNNPSKFEIEHLFGNAKLMAAALACAGILIIISSRCKEQKQGELSSKKSLIIGMVQGLCLPFRGFSRSGATISSALTLGISRSKAEAFSFALAVVLTPAVIVKEMLRIITHTNEITGGVAHAFMLSCLGMLLSFFAGLLALRWLSRWLAEDRWHLFGGYCLLAALFVLWVG